jgi:DNA repair exonuclease SbcCD nuclease subunit
MSRILYYSDIHIHPHKKKVERLHDCLAAQEWVFKTAADNNVSSIVFAGDLFQDRQKIDVMTYHLTFNIFEKYLTGNLRLWLLLGNHDLWYYDRWDINSVRPFSALPGVTIVEKPSTLYIEGHAIDFLPYTHTPIEHLDELRATAASRKGNKILVAHLAVHGAQLNTLHHTYSDAIVEHDGEMVKVDATVFRGWDQVFLGHYHGQQKIGDNTEYIGSTLQLSFGEAFQHKHVIIHDPKTGEKEYIRNTTSPQHFILKEGDVPKFEIENNFIQLAVNDLSSTGVIDLRRELEKQSPGSLEIIPVPKQETEQLVTDCKAIFLKEGEMMERWVDEAGTDGLERYKLLKAGTEVCEFQVTT